MARLCLWRGDRRVDGPLRHRRFITADQPGLVLFHCHSQLHMDYGFMALFETV